MPGAITISNTLNVTGNTTIGGTTLIENSNFSIQNSSNTDVFQVTNTLSLIHI